MQNPTQILAKIRLYYMTKFINRHIGVSDSNVNYMLHELGYSSIDEFIKAVIPEGILNDTPLKITNALEEHEALKKLKFAPIK